MSLTLCVLLWAHEGAECALIEYEDRVLPLVSSHGGRVLRRARSEGTGRNPLEIQLLEFPSQAALDSYANDERRTSLAADRDRVIARAEVFPVNLV
jgi:uncharacterized protein (DUF1330 family)